MGCRGNLVEYPWRKLVSSCYLPLIPTVKLILILLLVCSTLVSRLQADEALNRKEIEEIVVEAAGQPREQRIESLGLALQRLSRPSIFPDQEKVRGLQEEVREQLVSIPGYADYFGDKLRNHEARLLAGNGNLSEFDRDRLSAFEILQLSRSPDAVRVLVSFLDDDLGSPMARFPNQPADDDAPFAWTAALTVRSLGAMGLENAVTNSRIDLTSVQDGIEKHRSAEFIKMDVDRPKWKQWWAEIVAGKTTFRFKGSDVEYGANGPVTMQKAARHERGAATPPPGTQPSLSGAEAIKPGHPWWFAGLLAILVIAVLFGWHYKQGRQ